MPGGDSSSLTAPVIISSASGSMSPRFAATRGDDEGPFFFRIPSGTTHAQSMVSLDLLVWPFRPDVGVVSILAISPGSDLCDILWSPSNQQVIRLITCDWVTDN